MNRTRIDHPLRIAVTGHRKWSKPKLVKKRLWQSLDILCLVLQSMGIERHKIIFVHGCALGIDIWFGSYAYEKGLNFELYLPFDYDTQVKKGRFNSAQKFELNRQLTFADNVTVVNDKFSTYGYQRRNMVMVNNVNMLVSYYTRSRSGSGNCERYAIQEKKKIIDLRKLWKIFDITDPRQLSNALL